MTARHRLLLWLPLIPLAAWGLSAAAAELTGDPHQLPYWIAVGQLAVVAATVELVALIRRSSRQRPAGADRWRERQERRG